MEKTKLFGMPVRFLMPLVAVAVVCLLSAMPSRADGLIVSLSPLSDVAAGSTGNSFEVLLTNSSGATFSIAGFFFEVTSSSSDVTFTDATTATVAPYIFGSDSLFGPDIIGPGSTATDLNASDLDSDDGISLIPGETVGLGHVTFDVSATAPTQTVTFAVGEFPGTSLSDDEGNDVPIGTFDGGQFTIEGAVARAPEPPTLILLCCGAVRFGLLVHTTPIHCNSLITIMKTSRATRSPQSPQESVRTYWTPNPGATDKRQSE